MQLQATRGHCAPSTARLLPWDDELRGQLLQSAAVYRPALTCIKRRDPNVPQQEDIWPVLPALDSGLIISAWREEWRGVGQKQSLQKSQHNCFFFTFYPWSWRPGSSHCWKWSCGFLRSMSLPSHLKVHDCLARSLARRWWFLGWKASQAVGSLSGKVCGHTHARTNTRGHQTHTHTHMTKHMSMFSLMIIRHGLLWRLLYTLFSSSHGIREMFMECLHGRSKVAKEGGFYIICVFLSAFAWFYMTFLKQMPQAQWTMETESFSTFQIPYVGGTLKCSHPLTHIMSTDFCTSFKLLEYCRSPDLNCSGQWFLPPAVSLSLQNTCVTLYPSLFPMSWWTCILYTVYFQLMLDNVTQVKRSVINVIIKGTSGNKNIWSLKRFTAWVWHSRKVWEM